MNKETADSEQQPNIAGNAIETLVAEIGRAVIGQQQVVREVVIALLAAGHVLVEGVPGLGKTLLVRSLAAAVGGDFQRIQFTPDLMPADVTGHFMFDMKSNSFRVRKGPVFCNFLLADEVNRAPAKTQSSLLEVMQEQQVTIEGRSFTLSPPFLVLATQNPIEQEGTYPLPQAQLDRFLLKVFIDYPSLDEERALVRKVTDKALGDRLDTSAIRKLLSPTEILRMQNAAAAMEVDEQIYDYAVRIVRHARDWHGVEHGAGPRGGIALLRAARANALLEARRYVIPDDIKAIAAPVLRHRLKLTTDLEIEGYQPDDVLADILKDVEAPRV